MASKQPPKPEKQKRYYSPEERRRRSEMAKKLHAEGKLGGKDIGRRGGLAPKKKRAGAYVREKAQKNPAQIWRALAAGLQSPDPETQRKAAMAILEVERKDEELSLAEAVAYEKMRQDELIERVIGSLSKLGLAGKLPAGLPIIEAQLTDERGDQAA